MAKGKSTVKPLGIGLGKGQWKGNDLLVIGDPEDRYPFQFGAGKCRKMLKAINDNGIDVFIEALEEVCRSGADEELDEAA